MPSPILLSSARRVGAALAAMTEREKAVAAAMHELAADGSGCRWCASSATTLRGPAGGGRWELSRTVLSSSSTGSSSRRVSTAGPTRAASDARRSPTASQAWLLHSRDITFAMASPATQANLPATPSAWLDDVPWYTICTEPFSADFGVDKCSASTSSCATAMTSTAPTSFSTGRWSSSSAASGACGH